MSFGLDQQQLEDGIAVISVRGELDLFTAPELRARLRDQAAQPRPPVDLIVDLTHCAFVDASGCQALLRAARRLAADGRGIAIVNTSPGNTRIFGVMGLGELFPIVATRAEAATALRRSSGQA